MHEIPIIGDTPKVNWHDLRWRGYYPPGAYRIRGIDMRACDTTDVGNQDTTLSSYMSLDIEGSCRQGPRRQIGLPTRHRR